MDNNTPAMSMADGGIGNVQGQPLPEPAVKAATKVVNQYWDKHAQDIASLPGGIDLLHQIIQQHATGGLNDNPKIQPAQGMTSPAQVTPSGDIQQGGLFSWVGGHSTDDLLRRLTEVSKIQRNSAESALQGVTTLGAEQKILAGQPGEIALPQAQANIQQANIAAGAPAANVNLTKQQTEASKQELLNEQQKIKAGIYATKTERDIQHIQRLTDRRKQVLDQMNEDLQHGPIIGRGDRLKEYRRQLNWYDNQINSSTGMSGSNNSTPPPELIAAARRKGLIK